MKQFELIGGEVCLDFVNTIHDYQAADPREELEDFRDLVAFAKQSEGITDSEAAALLREAAAKPKEAGRTLALTREYRSALYRIFSAVTSRKEPANADWQMLNKLVSSIYQNVYLKKKGTNLSWEWRENRAGMDRVLWPIVRSSAALLTSEKKDLVRECSAEDCTWLFLDLSKNHTRRWCEMKKCGNRAKWHRHYDKTKKLDK